MEEFRDIIGYEGIYKVSNFGRVYNVKYDRFLKPGKLQNGYLLVVLCKGGKKKGFTVHRLVAEAFVPNPDNLPEVNHKDEDKLHNCDYNLEWCSKSYNVRYSQGKRVQQILDGNVIAEFSCIKEAAKMTGCKHSSISRCCNGDLFTHHGYEWRLVNGQ